MMSHLLKVPLIEHYRRLPSLARRLHLLYNKCTLIGGGLAPCWRVDTTKGATDTNIVVQPQPVVTLRYIYYINVIYATPLILAQSFTLSDS